MELVVASSSVDGGIGCWNLRSGAEQLHYRSCASPPHGLLSVSRRFLASSQLRENPSSSAPIFFWSWDKPQRRRQEGIYRYNFSEHALRVTSVVSGYGLYNSIVISSSKIWSLSEGQLRSITFPSIIDTIAMDPGEHTFYAGSRDAKIYVAALNAEWEPGRNYGKFIIGSLSDQSKAITCLAFSTDGATLVSGSEDGTIRIWNAPCG